ncbi:DNA-directed RNA polymerase subunit M/transcription elongation factor TFIIS [Aequitasia blattaphilus]|uniref:Uncharacterized protein n=1 Tax=Aequitasia blattaphilus TaxID=2949332 RepID=A0ABT1EA13_9FIRM|nr:hypothetical protein [Aequitasia blattaphilus]MCP1101347.1 hypothetical protein [Aequitasia blattaphilus]MCR8613987.1 hypothetical protein [Aequitasia blattaphilus]
MKCPTCGNELKRSEKNPEYLLCLTCRKKYKVAPKKYSNIPEAEVREKRERKVKKGYKEMVDAGYEEEKSGSIIPLVILGILIVLVAAFIIYLYFFK